MDNYNNLVSVIIPTYKRPENLVRAINSVLLQTYKPIEIIVVDDNGTGTISQKQTESLLKTFIDSKRIIYIKHDINRNGSAARNTGLKYSSGMYVCFLDDDDVFYPEKIEKQVDRLKSTDPGVGATYCNSIIRRKQNITGIIKDINTNCIKEGDLCFEYLTNQCKFNTSAILFKRDCIDKLKGFDISFTRHQDYELMTRFFFKYNIVCTSQEPLMLYDLTQVRTFVINGEKDYNIKSKFLSTFEENFERKGIKRQIFHFFWFQCLKNSIISHDYIHAKKAYDNALIYGRLTFKECYIVFKSILLSYLTKI